MATTSVERVETPAAGSLIIQGAIAGLVGGVVFGTAFVFLALRRRS